MIFRDVVFIFSALLISVQISHAEELVARIYGQPIYRSDISISKEAKEGWKKSRTEKEIKEELEILERLLLSKIIFDKAFSYTFGENSYTPTEKETQAYLEAKQRIEIESKYKDKYKYINELKSSMTLDQRKAEDEEQYKMAQLEVRRWKIDKCLYQKYGGRILYQQAGLEPVDAYRMLIIDINKGGQVEIISPEFRSILSPPIISEKQIFMNEKDAKTAFDQPWWEKGK